MTGAHNRHAPELRSTMTTMASSVPPATTGAAIDAAPSGTSVSLRTMTGASVTGISISTVPATVGVKILRSRDSLAARANWNRDEMTISVASRLGPPCSSAATQTAMNALLLPISIT